jgi:cytoskeletal protein CcmA (bactofilin family)
MPAVKTALQRLETADTVPTVNAIVNIVEAGPRRLAPAVLSPISGPAAMPAVQRRKEASFHPRVPVITGEATYRGLVSVGGIISGQLGAANSVLTIKQRPRNGSSESQPELDGELTFKDLLRINGHVAGKVLSTKGTLIVDTSARVEADINVGICVVSGTVVGDIIGHERVEVAAGAVVKGNIATRALSIKPGAVFQGDCRMLKDSDDS